jgi:3',5'-cyclic AMP phosphodiesterase CpdA
MSSPLRFAVMGDTHYVQPESHKEVFNGRPRGVTELADCTRNYWMTQHVLPEVISAIAALKPDFVIQTGDIIQGHCDDAQGGLREMEEALQLLSGVGAPLFFALGTHDGTVGRRGDEPVKELVYPAIGKALGTDPLTKGYYSFEKAGSLFVILDYTTFVTNDEQASFIHDVLSRSGKYEHVFLFSHPPLIPVGRPFFTKFEFVNTVLRELAEYPVDAYFCGHTHNQIASVHKIGNHWIPLLKSSVLGYPDQPPIPLTDVRPLLPDPSSFEYGWGYLEDSAPGWWLITVNGEEVQADWHVLRKGAAGQLRWRKGEKAVFTKRPDFAQTSGLALPKLEDIRSVRLRAAGDSCRTPDGYRVSLNGTPIGSLPRLEYFDCRQFLEIPAQVWPLLQASNRLSVTTPADDPMTIGGLVLEVETAAGWVRSSVSSYYTCTNKWERWGKSPLTTISPGETVNVELNFGSTAAK